MAPNIGLTMNKTVSYTWKILKQKYRIEIEVMLTNIHIKTINYFEDFGHYQKMSIIILRDGK